MRMMRVAGQTGAPRIRRSGYDESQGKVFSRTFQDKWSSREGRTIDQWPYEEELNFEQSQVSQTWGWVREEEIDDGESTLEKRL